MKKIATILCYFVSSVILAACAGSNPQAEPQLPLQKLNCVAVMPVMIADEIEAGYQSAGAKKNLQEAVGLAQKEIATLLTGNPQANLVSLAQVDGFTPETNKGRTGLITGIGGQTGCDGVMFTELQKFDQRVGSEYAVEQPASVAFTMSLFNSSTGEVLWTADYRETQESFLENVFSKKMGQQGFKWVRAEELLKQGIAERLNECPYLN